MSDSRREITIETIEDQHEMLEHLMSELSDALKKQRATEVAINILNELRRHTVIHFMAEESIMRMLRYPDYEEHKHEHDSLVAKIDELEERLQKGHKSANFELMHLLQRWMSKHVMETDNSFTSYFQFQGMSPASSRQKRSFFSKMFGKKG